MMSLVLVVVVGSPAEAGVRLAQDGEGAPREAAPALEEGEVLLLDDDDAEPTPIDQEGRELKEGEVLELDDEQEIVLEDEPPSSATQTEEQAPAAEPELDGWAEFEQDLAAFLDGNWLDPPGEFWAVRRGGRLELSFFLGGEAAAGKIQPGDISVITDFGGVVLTPVARWYPVDQVAMVAGMRGFLGLGEFAAGTGAQTVLTPFFGVRYDLVKEGRLSFLIDVYSGPAMFVFAGLTDAETTANLLDRVLPLWALGAEIGGGLVGRYSLGPTTFELRGTVGGRAGSASDIVRPSGEVGPFSAFYAGIDLGITWSFLADGKIMNASSGKKDDGQ